MNGSHPGRRLLWLSDQSHVEHPFMRQWIVACHEAGHEVHVVDRTSDSIDVPYQHTGSAFHREGIRIRGRLVGRTGKISRSVGWFLLLVRSVRTHPDVCVADLPLTLLAGWLCKLVFGCRLVYHPYELFGEQSSQPSRLIGWIERALLKGPVDCLVTQNEMRASFYKMRKDYCGELVVVGNTKKMPQLSIGRRDIRKELGVPAGMRIVIYEGVLIPGRCLEELIEAFTVLNRADIGLVLVGRVTAWAEEKLAPRWTDPCAEGRVWHMDHVPHDEVVSLISGADAGVIIYDPRYLNNFYCAPGKLNDYLHACIPLIVPDFPTIGELVRLRQIGVTFDHPSAESISKAVLEVLSRPREEWAENIVRAREEISYENDLRALLGALKVPAAGLSTL